MSEELGFKFYSVLKNEDADPFEIEGLMVVADGLGGAGSVVHELDKYRYKNPDDHIKRTLLCVALPEYNEQKHPYLAPYVKTWLAPMIDAEPDTSALWASRIAIARFVFALTEMPEFFDKLSDEDARKDISKFVTKGLDETVATFRLQPGKYDNQKLLPTTLAALQYSVDGSEVTVDAVWAGDSRCYVLTLDGLKQLTIDDEDEAEAITNLFSAEDKKNQRPYKRAVLRHRQYKFKQPCVLIAVSDGVFDPYAPHDSLGVEAVLLEKLLACKSSAELSDALKVHYDKVHGDDATMVFEPFGFDSYWHMRELFVPRAQKVIDIWSKYHKMRSTLAIIDSPEAADDIVGKITSRTADKLETIAQLLVEAYSGKKKDFVLDAVGMAVIESTQERLRQEFERNKKVRQRESFMKAKERILNDFYDIGSRILSRKTIPFNEKRFEQIFSGLKEAASNLIHVDADREALNKLDQKAMADYADLGEEIKRRIDENHTLRLSRGFSYGASSIRMIEEYTVLHQIKQYHEKRWIGCSEISGLTTKYAKSIALQVEEVLRQLKENVKKRISLQRDYDAKLGQYKKMAKSFLDYEIVIVEFAQGLFQPAFVAECGFDVGKGEFAFGADASTAIMKDLLKEFRSNPKTVEIIVKALADNYINKSVIDSCYNESRLNNFREYYRLKATSSADAESFKAELEAFVAEYEKLLS